MEINTKIGLILVSIDLAVLIAIIVMYPVHSIIGLIAILYGAIQS